MSMVKLKKNGLSLDLSGPWGTVQLAGIRPALIIDGAYLLTGRPDRSTPSGRGIDFEWNQLDDSENLTLSLQVTEGFSPGEIIINGALTNRSSHPVLIATDIHFTMGGVEAPECSWNEKKRQLSGLARRKKGDEGSLFFYLPTGYNHKGAQRVRGKNGSIFPLKIRFTKTEETWLIQF